MTFEEWYETFDSDGYSWEGFVKADLEAAFAAGFREASDKAATLPHRAMYDAGYEAGMQSSTPYTEGYAKGYSDGVEEERERLQPYIDQLEQAWLQLTRGNLIDGGMKVEQARIYAQARLDEAKHKILSSAIRGQG